MLNKIKGALYGFAIGDALGGTTEFLTKEEIKKKYGAVTEILGGGAWKLEKGETTDDTAMTLAVARGILQKPDDPIEAIGDEFLNWYRSRPKDVGIIISTVLGIYDGDWNEAARRAHYQFLDGRSAGNGSLMRCLPVALAYGNLETVEDITRKQSRMTHYDMLAEEACVIYNRIAFKVLHGSALKQAIKEEITGTIFEEILDGRKPGNNPDGFVVHTMNWVLYWLLNNDNYLDVVVGAANEGYDTDTIAAIAGGLAGLESGFEELPEGLWREILDKHLIDEVSIKLYKLLM
ncbi:ADP-ribosylglycohydrolase family protein [Mesobacillus jeotgali]|uniref:ADP-ribosylglycohydrolase family protein n=1 Tax=Mesobacillus jeotgali TaxID=129985 RepID=UPI001783B960|nr:ADP-ribosylglycohydrolase family protein [Mesobacillus jeotgali]UYZ21735.1 ADP-ribosylglycohydrolase family protein [Mesobacillus jeotgali]